MEPNHAPVSPEDRRRLERQRAALAQAENTEEDGAWEGAVIAWANGVRATTGVEPLDEWWQSKTEPELHRRARALGLLD